MASFYTSPPSFQQVTLKPEELAKQYVEDVKKYKQQLHKQRIDDMVMKFADAYKMNYNGTRYRFSTIFEPRLPTPEDKIRYVYIYNNNYYATTSYTTSYDSSATYWSNTPW